MGVNHYLLPISDAELASILRTPEQIRALVERRSADVQTLREDGVAIVALTAASDEDPLAFIRAGAPDAVSGWVGKYTEDGGRVVECEVDMVTAQRPITETAFCAKSRDASNRSLVRPSLPTASPICWRSTTSILPDGETPVEWTR